MTDFRPKDTVFYVYGKIRYEDKTIGAISKWAKNISPKKRKNFKRLDGRQKLRGGRGLEKIQLIPMFNKLFNRAWQKAMPI